MCKIVFKRYCIAILLQHKITLGPFAYSMAQLNDHRQRTSEHFVRRFFHLNALQGLFGSLQILFSFAALSYCYGEKTESLSPARSLYEALEATLEDSHYAKLEEYQRQQAAVERQEAFLGAFTPSATLRWSQNYYEEKGSTQALYPSPTRVGEVELFQPLWDGRAIERYRAQVEQERTRGEQSDLQQSQRGLELLSLWSRALDLKEQATVLTWQKREAKRNRDIFTKREELGLEERAALLQARALEKEIDRAFAVHRQEQIEVEQTLLELVKPPSAASSMAPHFDFSKEEFFLVEQLVISHVMMIKERACSLRGEERQDLRAARHQLKALELHEKSALMARLPSISLMGHASTRDPSSSTVPSWSAGLQVVWPLLDRGRLYGTYAKTGLEKKKQRSEIALLEQKIERQQSVAQARSEEREALVEAWHQEEQLALERFRIEQERFERGLISHHDYLEALIALVRVQTSLARHQRDLVRAKLALIEAYGQGSLFLEQLVERLGHEAASSRRLDH